VITQTQRRWHLLLAVLQYAMTDGGVKVNRTTGDTSHEDFPPRLSAAIYRHGKKIRIRFFRSRLNARLETNGEMDRLVSQ